MKFGLFSSQRGVTETDDFHQVMSVANSMRSLVWTLLLMLLMKYIIGAAWTNSYSRPFSQVLFS